MRIVKVLIFLFILSALAIGSGLSGNDLSIVDQSINNVSSTIQNISLDPPSSSEIPNMKGLYLILEKYINFIGTAGLEVLRTGIYFGADNPDYFEPFFIYKIIKLIIIFLIISILIKPLGYIVIFLILGIKYLLDKRKMKNERKE